MKRCVSLLFAVLLLLTGCKKAPPALSDQVTGGYEGYCAVTPMGMGFLAVGSVVGPLKIDADGSVAAISLSNSMAHMLGAFTDADGAVWIAGGNGTLAVYDPLLNKSTTVSVGGVFYAVARFGDCVLAGGVASNATRLMTVTGIRATPSYPDLSGAVGTVRAIAATDEWAAAFTDAGEILTSSDGVAWSKLDYRTDAGESVRFAAAIHAGGLIYAAGTAFGGAGERPVLLSSLMGGVWSERDLNYLDGSPADLSDTRLFSLAWDGGQLYAATGTGELLVLPDCAQCNTLRPLSPAGSYRAVTYNGGVLAAVAKNGAVAVIDADSARQFKITAATAHEKQLAGEALIIDVREQDEYDAGHIKDCLLMPLGQLETLLPARVPDQTATLIFYCAKGVRSQTAVEKARALGYTDAYSLGGLGDWPYDTE